MLLQADKARANINPHNGGRISTTKVVFDMHMVMELLDNNKFSI